MWFSSCCKKNKPALAVASGWVIREKKLTRVGMWLNAFLILALLAIPVAPVQAASWRDDMPQAQALGSGDLRWFGLKIYTAKLWSEKSPFDPSAPFALELTYHRSISRNQFVETSIDEIKRLFGTRYSAATLARWDAEMRRAFTDVSAGDQLIGVYLPTVGCRFYDKKQLLAEIRDLEFARAFFAIWFDERSKDKVLRAQLLGGS